MRATFRAVTLAASLAAVGALTACASSAPPPPTYYPSAAGHPAQNRPEHVEFGRLTNVEVMYESRRRSGGGALLGAVIGGVLGNQIGGGTGRAAATVLGAVGGAVVGNNVEDRNSGERISGYRLSIEMDRGGYRAYDVPDVGDLRIGDRVRVNREGHISRV